MNYDWDQQFHELSLKERITLIISGLQCPEDTGEYKEARYQLKRLASPVSAVTVPFILLILIMLLAAECFKTETTGTIRYVKEVTIKDELEKIEKPEEKIETPDHKQIIAEITKIQGPSESDPPPVISETSAEPMPNIHLIKSPLRIKRLYRGSSSVIGAGLAEGGGSGTTELAVLKALRWLQYVQEEDGSWKQESGGGPGKGTAPAMTGLALLTFLAHGDTPASEEFGETIEKAIKWLILNQESDGRFKGRDQHDYSHPIAAYALCETVALTQIPVVREAAEKAVDVLIKGQNASGGWDYNCKQSDRNDTSYMGWCVQALHAAYKANLSNINLITAIQNAEKGLRQNSTHDGGFGYTGPKPTNLTGVGVLCLQLLEKSEDPLVKQGIKWLEKATIDWNNPWGKSPLYYWYYVTQVKFRASPEIWEEWNPLFSTTLVKNQTPMEEKNEKGKDMGYWKACSESEHCKSYVYNTTLCTLMLEVYYRHLHTFKTDNDHNDINYISKSDVPVEIIINDT